MVHHIAQSYKNIQLQLHVKYLIWNFIKHNIFWTVPTVTIIEFKFACSNFVCGILQIRGKIIAGKRSLDGHSWFRDCEVCSFLVWPIHTTQVGLRSIGNWSVLDDEVQTRLGGRRRWPFPSRRSPNNPLIKTHYLMVSKNPTPCFGMCRNRQEQTRCLTSRHAMFLTQLFSISNVYPHLSCRTPLPYFPQCSQTDVAFCFWGCFFPSFFSLWRNYTEWATTIIVVWSQDLFCFCRSIFRFLFALSSSPVVVKLSATL